MGPRTDVVSSWKARRNSGYADAICRQPMVTTESQSQQPGAVVQQLETNVVPARFEPAHVHPLRSLAGLTGGPSSSQRFCKDDGCAGQGRA
jgi:hypothetical protein